MVIDLPGIFCIGSGIKLPISDRFSLSKNLRIFKIFPRKFNWIFHEILSLALDFFHLQWLSFFLTVNLWLEFIFVNTTWYVSFFSLWYGVMQIPLIIEIWNLKICNIEGKFFHIGVQNATPNYSFIWLYTFLFNGLSQWDRGAHKNNFYFWILLASRETLFLFKRPGKF